MSGKMQEIWTNFPCKLAASRGEKDWFGAIQVFKRDKVLDSFSAGRDTVRESRFQLKPM